MRPPLLNPLFASLTALPGIGPKLEKLFGRLIERDGEPPRIIDLLFHMPTSHIDRRNQPKLSDVKPDTVVTVAVTVDRHRPPPPNRPRSPYLIYASDETTDLIITYFNARRDYLLARPQAASPQSITSKRADMDYAGAWRCPRNDGETRGAALTSSALLSI